MLTRFLVLAVFPFLLAACAVTSPGEKLGEPDSYEAISDYLTWLDSLESDLRNNEPRSLSEREWKEFNKLMARTREIYDGHEQIDELDDETRMLAFNAHEELTSLVVDDGRPPVQCRMEHRTGTHFKELRCMRRGSKTTDAFYQEWLQRQMHTINLATRAEGPGVRQ